MATNVKDFQDKVYRAKEKLQKEAGILPTFLEKDSFLSEKYQANIFLKREDTLQPVRSYKLRGAFNAISKLSNKERDQGLVCSSAGNHAQGFAFACQLYKAFGKVFMPKTAPRSKIEATKTIGGEYVEIILIGDSFDETNTVVQNYLQNSRAIFIPPFDHPDTIEGQGTIAYEIMEQMQSMSEKVDMILVPVGGGGVLAGIMKYLEGEETKVIGVEPEGAASMKNSLEGGARDSLQAIQTICDGVAVKLVGSHTFDIIQKQNAEIITVPDGLTAKVLMDFFHNKLQLVEPSGVLSVASLDLLQNRIKNKNIVCIVSGGNIDTYKMSEYEQMAKEYEGTLKKLTVTLKDIPGALEEMLHILSTQTNISHMEYTQGGGPISLHLENENAQMLQEEYKQILELKDNNLQEGTQTEIFYNNTLRLYFYINIPDRPKALLEFIHTVIQKYNNIIRFSFTKGKTQIYIGIESQNKEKLSEFQKHLFNYDNNVKFID